MCSVFTWASTNQARNKSRTILCRLRRSLVQVVYRYRNEEKTKNISVSCLLNLILSVVTYMWGGAGNVEAQRKALVSRIQFERERDDTRKGKKKAREGWGEKERRAGSAHSTRAAQHKRENHSYKKTTQLATQKRLIIKTVCHAHPTDSQNGSNLLLPVQISRDGIVAASTLLL